MMRPLSPADAARLSHWQRMRRARMWRALVEQAGVEHHARFHQGLRACGCRWGRGALCS
jgi:hypothetical protein